VRCNPLVATRDIRPRIPLVLRRVGVQHDDWGVRTRLIAGGFVTLALTVGSQAVLPAASTAEATALETSVKAQYTFTRAESPSRTLVRDGAGSWVATFTDGARSVAVTGPTRRFAEPSVAATVASTTWVRLLPAPFAGRVDVAWLEQARADASPDVLATAMQYIAGSSDLVTADGTLLAADASYGPLQSDGTRQEGSDWNDLQGVTATYPDTTDAPEAQQLRSLDCSGFVRMLWGTRSGIPLGLRPDGGATLPRRAVQQASSAPGVVPVADTGAQVTDLRRLQPGDLVFFDASSDDGTAIDHVGVYLGLDGGGRHRFISSRKSTDGPTMGDLRGASVLDGSGFYARAFRSTRRL
jgi:cell wall-associated NlpC family hydrolase